jgi:hypothetical protein
VVPDLMATRSGDERDGRPMKAKGSNVSAT